MLKLRLKAALITLVIATVVPLLVFILFTNPGIIFTLVGVVFASFVIFLIYLRVFLILKEVQERNATRKS